MQAQNDKLELLARHGLEITSTEDEIHIVAKKKVTLNAGGSYITLDPSASSRAWHDYSIKSAHFEYSGPASMRQKRQETKDVPRGPSSSFITAKRRCRTSMDAPHPAAVMPAAGRLR